MQDLTPREKMALMGALRGRRRAIVTLINDATTKGKTPDLFVEQELAEVEKLLAWAPTLPVTDG
jgi:hypothetical protein